MRAFIAVYEPFGASVVRCALGLRSSPDVRVEGVDQRSSVPSVGYWAVRNHNCRAIMVMDAQSTYPEATGRVEVDITSNMIYRPCVTTHVAVPEVAVVLFHSPEHLAAILGVEITPEELIRAEYVPGEILDALIARSPRVRSRDELIQQVGDDYAGRMRGHPLMIEIACSLGRAVAPATGADEGCADRWTACGAPVR